MAYGKTDSELKDELEKFKQDINLVHFAAKVYGYEVEEHQSTPNSIVMRHPSKERKNKIVVAKSKSNHWIYFHVANSSNSGTIIDFVQNQDNVSLGAVRKVLNRDIGVVDDKTLKKYRTVSKSQFNRGSIIHKIQSMERHAPSYLFKRGLLNEVIEAPLFKGRIFADSRGNAIFPHYDDKGICGYEIKNHELSQFAKHGRRTFWCSNNTHIDNVFVVESAIDAIAHYQLHQDNSLWYISLGGAISGVQQAILAKQLADKKFFRMGVDNDEAGDRFIQIFKELFSNRVTVNRPPKHVNDWTQLIELTVS